MARDSGDIRHIGAAQGRGHSVPSCLSALAEDPRTTGYTHLDLNPSMGGAGLEAKDGRTGV